MAGIAGILRFDGQALDPAHIGLMTARMQQRGPDGIRHWVQGPLALGQCHMHTTPESLDELLPLFNDDASLALVMDGRLDNWQELRRDLLALGANLRTRADAELMLRGYEIWGEQCLERFQGDYALVILHVRERRLLCARDHMGNRPLYYLCNRDLFVFASELPAILALPMVARELNEGMLCEWLAAVWYSCEETIWKGVLRLQAAHCLQVAAGRVSQRCYWRPEPGAEPALRTDGEYIERYKALLADSTRRMSRSHLPVGVEVSGGLDSSAILALACDLQGKHELPAPSVQGYHLDWSFDAKADETAYIAALENFWNITIKRVAPQQQSLEWSRERARQWLDFPPHPNTAMGQPLLQVPRADGCRVLLNGMGGDDWLSGTRLYYAEELGKGRLGNLARCWQADRRDFSARQACYWLLRFGGFPLLPAALQNWLQRGWRAWLGRGSHQDADDPYWLHPDLRRQLTLRARPTSRWPRPRSGWQELANIYADPFLRWSTDSGDRISAQHGLDARSPMNTPVIVQCMLDTPERLRLQGKTHKYLHVRAMEGLLPACLLERRNKAEFSVAFRFLEDMRQLLIEDLPRRHPAWFDEQGLQRLYADYAGGQQGGWPQYRLWHLLACHLLTEIG
jgi:asparagine synthase (glutamine-hydrolysing)